MRRLLQWLLLGLARVVRGRRSRVRAAGPAEPTTKPGPYLVLPSHPAYMDPPNVLRALWGTFKMRPMLLETNFENPLLAPFAWVLRAIKVPDLDRASAEARQRTEAAVQTVIDALKA